MKDNNPNPFNRNTTATSLILNISMSISGLNAATMTYT
jgi:hypothetical protein